MTQLAPIILFTYNRLSETKQTVEALQKNFLARESELYIFSDGAKNKEKTQKIEELRDYLKTIEGFKTITIFEAKENKGLACSIVEGVSQIILTYGKVIVLEDDLVTTPNFLDFMNKALVYYSDNPKIKSINGYSLDLKSGNNESGVYYHNRPFPWGWGTWKAEWNSDLFSKKQYYSELMERKRLLHNLVGEDVPRMLSRYLKGDNDSWYVRWLIQHLQEEKLSVYPVLSKVENIGFNTMGTHCKNINTYEHKMDNGLNRSFDYNNNIGIPNGINTKFLKFFKRNYKFFFRFRLLQNKNGRKMIYKEITEMIG